MEPSEHHQHDAQDRLLWERFASRPADPDSACPSPGELAALIDGTPIGTDERAAIDRHLAACLACREAMADAKSLIAAQAKTPITAPPDVIVRAQALVGEIGVPVVTLAPPRSDRMRLVRDWLLPARLDPGTLGRWGLSAAASIVVCLLGYQAGAQSSAVAVPETDLVTELTFGVGLDGPTDLDLLLAVSDESGVGS